MTEPTTSLPLSVKLKEAGAPQDGHWFWVVPYQTDLLKPPQFVVWCKGYVGDKDTEALLHIGHQEVARAFTAGELIDLIHQAGWMVSCGWETGEGDIIDGKSDAGHVFSHATVWRSITTDGGETYEKEGMVYWTSDLLSENLGRAYLHILTQQKT